MDLGPNAAFIVAAYAAMAIVLAILVLWVATDYRVQQRNLEELESRSPRRH
jgi:heme exporter protein D